MRRSSGINATQDAVETGRKRSSERAAKRLELVLDLIATRCRMRTSLGENGLAGQAKGWGLNRKVLTLNY